MCPTSVQLLLARHERDPAYLRPALGYRQPRENLLDDCSLVHHPSKDNVLVGVAAQEVAEQVADVVEHQRLCLGRHLKGVCLPAPVPVEKDRAR